MTKTYNNPREITRTLNSYIDKMVKFDSDGKGTFRLYNDAIDKKELRLAIPANTRKEQMEAIQESYNYAKNFGIDLIVTKVK